MRIEGQIFLEELSKKRFIVDAEPHIMLRLRKMFDDSASTYYVRGNFTHKPLIFSITLSSCKDLMWLMTRYNFECTPEALEIINSKSKEYDEIVKNVEEADNDPVYKESPTALKLALPLREHQIKFNNMFKSVKRMLLADKIGLGKTPSAISTLCEPGNRPALVIVPAHLCTQWEREINRFLPDASSHVIRGFKTYKLPVVDVIITSYNRLSPWQDILLAETSYFKTIIFDEVHELRHTGTQKRDLSKILSERANQSLGLSGTPIFNLGNEIWSVLDVLKPDCLGGYDEFHSEWCSWGKVLEPATLNNYLKKQGLMLRRSAEEIGQSPHIPSKNIITIDADMEKLKEIENVARTLALSVLSRNVGEDAESAREFDWRLRHATGVAKAKPVAEFIRMLLDSEEKILVGGWHRDFYHILQKELKDFKIVMYTGTESIKEKDEAVRQFVEGDARIFLISLRSGSGLDGLQRVCNTVVLGELDWSPHVMDQLVGRVAREGQIKHVQAFYLTIADGADPFMMERIGEKRSQHDGLIEGRESEADLLKDVNHGLDRIREMAQAYLISIGEDIPEPIPEDGTLGEVLSVLRRLKVPTNTEAEMQDAIYSALQSNLDSSIGIIKEHQLTKRSRLDFLLLRDTDKIAIECKINSTKRAEVYRQVRRYIEEGDISAVILFAPWHGISSFKVDHVPVIVLDTTCVQL